MAAPPRAPTVNGPKANSTSNSIENWPWRNVIVTFPLASAKPRNSTDPDKLSLNPGGRLIGLPPIGVTVFATDAVLISR